MLVSAASRGNGSTFIATVPAIGGRAGIRSILQTPAEVAAHVDADRKDLMDQEPTSPREYVVSMGDNSSIDSGERSMSQQQFYGSGDVDLSAAAAAAGAGGAMSASGATSAASSKPPSPGPIPPISVTSTSPLMRASQSQPQLQQLLQQQQQLQQPPQIGTAQFDTSTLQRALNLTQSYMMASSAGAAADSTATSDVGESLSSGPGTGSSDSKQHGHQHSVQR